MAPMMQQLVLWLLLLGICPTSSRGAFQSASFASSRSKWTTAPPQFSHHARVNTKRHIFNEAFANLRRVKVKKNETATHHQEEKYEEISQQYVEQEDKENPFSTMFRKRPHQKAKTSDTSSHNATIDGYRNIHIDSEAQEESRNASEDQPDRDDNLQSSEEDTTPLEGIFAPSFLSDSSVTNGTTKKVLIPVLNETLLKEALEKLGPMTMSDPFFSIGAATSGNTNVTNNGNGTNDTVKRKSYSITPVLLQPNKFGVLQPSKFFSYNTLKMPPINTKSKNGTKTDAANNISSTMSNPLTVVLPSLSNANFNASSITNLTNYPFELYDPALSEALSFLDEQANFTKQQMEAAQKVFFAYSANATKQLDSAQKALLEYGFKALEETAAAVSTGAIIPSTPPISVAGSTASTGGTGLSVEALEAYLRLNGYVKQADLEGTADPYLDEPTQVGRGRQKVMSNKRSSTGFLAVGSKDSSYDGISAMPTTTTKGKGDKAVASSASSQQTKGRVAFPQPSILSYANLKWGSTAAASLLGLLGGVTAFPNLWLLGAVFGGLYGYDVSKNIAEKPPTNALAKVVVYSGRELTKKYLWVYDFLQGLWFMYKTGQLSYDYWKKYAALDEQFAIQAKMDAWNARFQKGKENFDKWEQENEVGRKILAGMRTFWLVEEQSKKKSKSRYRVIQWCYDASRYIGQRCAYLYSKRGKAFRDLQAVAEGMRQELMDPSQWKERMGPRVAAALAALTFVNLTGALFSASPLLLGLVAAILGGIVWPTWFSEWLSKLGTFVEETKARGTNGPLSGVNSPKRGTPKRSLSSPSDKPKVLWPFMDKKEKERYHFYSRPDGSKRFYRTGGNPWDANSNLSNMWNKKKKEAEKPWWSLK